MDRREWGSRLSPPSPCLCSQRTLAKVENQLFLHRKGLGAHRVMLEHDGRCELEFSSY